MNGRLRDILERIRHRNTVKAEAQKDISFFHSLDRDEDRLSFLILSYPDENRIDMYHPTCEGVHCPVLYFYFSGWKADDCPRINGKVFAGHELLDLLDSSNRNLKDMMPKLRPL